jgi:hypothetical protein
LLLMYYFLSLKHSNCFHIASSVRKALPYTTTKPRHCCIYQKDFADRTLGNKDPPGSVVKATATHILCMSHPYHLCMSLSGLPRSQTW